MEFESFYPITKVHSSFDCLVILSSYVTIYEQLDRLMKEGKKRFICTGCTGFGKSLFAYYLIYKLITDKDSYLYLKDNTERNILFQSEKGMVVHITKDGNKKYVIPSDKYLELLEDRNAIIFVDMKAAVEPDEFTGTKILLCSPDPKRYKEFDKSSCDTWFFNKLTDEEMLTLQDRKFNHLDKAGVATQQSFYGNNPRHVFENFDKGVSRFYDALLKSPKMVDELIIRGGVGVGSTELEKLSYTLMYPYSNRKDMLDLNNTKRYQYVSDKAKKLVEHQLNERQLKEVNKFLFYTIDSRQKAFVGHLFEDKFHQTILSTSIGELKGLKNDRRYVNMPNNPTQYLKTHPSVTYDFKCHYDDLAELEQHVNIEQLKHATYYYPEKKNVASYDSFGIIRDADNEMKIHLYVYQVTVSLEHSIIADNLDKLYELIKKQYPNYDIVCYFVFVCLENKFDSEKFKAQKMTKKKSEPIKDYLQIPVNARIFERNQWIAMVNVDPTI